MDSPASTATTSPFVTANGDEGANPLALVDSPQVSLSALASSLANPVLETNVGAASPWVGVRRARPVFEFGRGMRSEIGELRDQFTAAVRRCLGAAQTAVVLFSGGLDSLALLVEAARQCAADGRRLVPVVCDLVDDVGLSAAHIARRQAEAVPACPPLHVLSPHVDGELEPPWSACGPRMEAHGGFVRRLHELAEGFPEPVVLDGAGGDEALAAWNFGTRDLIAARRARALQRYLAAFARQESITQVLGEALSLAGRGLGVERSFRWYLASAWPLLIPDLAGAVGPRFRATVKGTHVQWLQDRLAVFRDQEQNWERAMFFDQVYPFVYDAHPLDAPVPHRSPFTDRRFLAYCAGMPWRWRFDPVGPPYWWYKALQLRLIPQALWAVAARYKMLFSSECQGQIERTFPQGELELRRLGVLRLGGYGELAKVHGYLPLAARNAELWLRGALARGYQVVS